MYIQLIKKMQSRVEDWVSEPQHKVKYFPPFEIVAQLAEEVAELELAINETILSHGNNHMDVKKEVGDVFFVLCCLSNSKKINPKPIKDTSIYLGTEEIICLWLYRKVGDVAREVSHLDGFKKKKPEEKTNGLEIVIGQILYLLQELCVICQFDADECFNLTMEKKKARDKNRFAK